MWGSGFHYLHKVVPSDFLLPTRLNVAEVFQTSSGIDDAKEPRINEFYKIYNVQWILVIFSYKSANQPQLYISTEVDSIYR